MSLVNVGVFGASAAAAIAGAISATPTTHCVSCLMFVLPLPILRPDGHFRVGIGPAALKAATALTRFVIRLHAQGVVAGGGERGRDGEHGGLLEHPKTCLVVC